MTGQELIDEIREQKLENEVIYVDDGGDIREAQLLEFVSSEHWEDPTEKLVLF